jgi:hypothetical protein
LNAVFEAVGLRTRTNLRDLMRQVKAARSFRSEMRTAPRPIEVTPPEGRLAESTRRRIRKDARR